VVDQHFLRRNRVSRLLSVMADHPRLVGLGIDERTALVVQLPGRRLSVVGDSYVIACIPGTEDDAPRLEILKPGDRLDLVALQESLDPGAAVAPADAVESR
jgi:cyanophycinase